MIARIAFPSLASMLADMAQVFITRMRLFLAITMLPTHGILARGNHGFGSSGCNRVIAMAIGTGRSIPINLKIDSRKALALPSSQTINGFECPHRLHGKVTVENRCSWFAAQLLDHPLRQNRFFEPEGEASPLLESSVILRPVADAVLRFHGMFSLW
jgi:hypothetical protein